MHGGRRLLVTAAVAVAALSVATPASAQRMVAPLGALPGGSATEVTDINDSGLSVGYSTTATTVQAVRWSASGRPTSLATPAGADASRATAISANGTVVGIASFTPAVRAIRWAADGTSSELPVPAGSGGCVPTDISDTGGIVGRCAGKSVKWNTDGTITELLPLPGAADATVEAVNANGVAVGWSRTANSLSYPVIWAADGTVTQLWNTPGQAFGVNAKGQAVGQIEVNDGSGPTWHAVRWDAPLVTRSLGGVPGAKVINNVAVDINEDGTAVGRVDGANGSRLAARWSVDGVFLALSRLTPSATTENSIATAINQGGVIVGQSDQKSARWTGYR